MPAARPLARLVISAVLAAAACACSATFPSGDVSEIVRDRSALWFTATPPLSYSVYGGYGSPCAQAAAFANFGSGSQTYVVAAVDGVVASVQNCVISGTNDKYTLSLAIGQKGSVPVYLDYSMEPMGGKACSAAGQPSDYFQASIYVGTGSRVSKGDQLANFTSASASGHVAVNLRADGALICPEIFPAVFFPPPTIVSLSPTSCGTESIPAATLCHDLTPSEDPANLE